MRVLPLVLALAFAAFPAAAQADAPPNDGFANAKVIDPATLPYSDSVDSSEATTEPGEPAPCGDYGRSVWYSITPTKSGVIQVDTNGSATYNVVSAYSGTSLGTLNSQGCGYSGSAVDLHASAGVTYYIQISAPGAVMRLNISSIPAPPNDDFADASVIDPGSLPFNDTQSAQGATRQTGEQSPSCSAFGPANNSWWYAFTPSRSNSYTVTANNGGVPTVALYTGSALGGLSERDCRFASGRAFTFAGTAGTTYHVRVDDYYGGVFGPVQVSLTTAPDPVADFGTSPSDPNPYDTMTFFDQSSDPGGNSFSSEKWDFGTARCSPTRARSRHIASRLTATTRSS